MDQSISEIFLKINNLTVIRGKSKVFSDYNTSFFSRKINVLKGPNGSGKTTLLKIISGLIFPNYGQVLWSKDLKNKINFVSHSNGLSPTLTVKMNLENWIKLFEIKEKVENILSFFNIQNLVHKKVKELSEGQQRKVALSRLFVSQRKVWILDEPLEALDKNSKDIFCNLLLDHIKNNGMIIISSNQELNNIPKSVLNEININQLL